MQNKALQFAALPSTTPTAGQHLIVQDVGFDLAAQPSLGGFVARVLYASFDPYLRHRMVAATAARDGFAPLAVGAIVPNIVIARVLTAGAEAPVKVGDVVMGMAPIQEYIRVEGDEASAFRLIPHDSPGLGLPLFLGPLGLTGLTAYTAFYHAGRPQRGETMWVSAAAGALGQVVAQLGRRAGLRVIGSAGSSAKVAMLTDAAGFDAAFNYHDGDILGQLQRLAPEGIDIYFDSVGGEQLSAALTCLRNKGRIIACGYASQYNVAPDSQYGVRNTGEVIAKRLTWQGISVFEDGPAYAEEHQVNVGRWISEGTFHVNMDVTRGIDDAAVGLARLLAGQNMGKSYLDFGVGA